MESVNPEKKLKLDRLLQPNGNASFLQSQMIEVTISCRIFLKIIFVIIVVVTQLSSVHQDKK